MYSNHRQSNSAFNSKLNQNHNNSSHQQHQLTAMMRTTSEPRLLSNSTDSLSVLANSSIGNTPSIVLRDVLYRKSEHKSNILQTKWTKVWAVLQETLHIN